MLISDLLKGFKKTDWYDFYLWAAWYFRPNKISCIDCIKTRAKISGIPPDCCKCGNPTAAAMQKYFKNKGDKSDGKKIQ